MMVVSAKFSIMRIEYVNLRCNCKNRPHMHSKVQILPGGSIVNLLLRNAAIFFSAISILKLL